MDHSLMNSREDLFEPVENFLIKHTDYKFDSFDFNDYVIPEKIKQIPKTISEEFFFSKNVKIGVKNYGCFGSG